MAESALTKGRNFWVKGLYRNQSSDTVGSYKGFTSNSYGTAFGLQFDIDNITKIGFSLAGITDNVSVKEAQGSKEGQSLFASVYGVYSEELGRLRLFSSAALGFGYHDNENKRLVTNDSVRSFATSTSTDKDINLTLQTGIKFMLSQSWYAMPKISGSYIYTMGGGFRENDGGAAAVTVKSYDFSTLKLRESIRFGNQGGIGIGNSFKFSPYFEFGVSQERALTEREISGTFSNGSAFTSNLNKSERDFINLIVGTDFRVSQNVSAFINYENSSSGEENRSDVRAGMSIRF